MAKTTLLPVESRESSLLKGLPGASAQLMGINLTGGSDISLLYEPILTSRRIIINVLKNSFNIVNYDKKVPLLDILEIEGESIEDRLNTGYKRFIDDIVEVEVVRNNRITTIYVKTSEPQSGF